MLNKEGTEYVLSEHEKEWIRAHAKKLNYSIKDLTAGMTGDPKKDGRSFEGKAIKQFLVEDLGAKPKVRTVDSKKYKEEVRFELTEDHKTFINNNRDGATPLEMMDALFPEEMEGLSKKQKMLTKQNFAITRYLQEEFGEALPVTYKEVFFKKGKFAPPENIIEGVIAVNRYASQNLDSKTIKDHQRESILKMNKNLSRISVINSINHFNEAVEREVYLESFISDTWDKGDLTAGEISQYFDLAGERVHLIQIKKQQQVLSEMFDEAVASGDKIQYTLNESIDKQITNRDKCMGRIEKLQKSLEGTRTQRLKEKAPENVTILSIIEVFMNAKKRKEFLEMQKKQDEALKDTLDNYETMDEHIARILGATKSEIISQS